MNNEKLLILEIQTIYRITKDLKKNHEDDYVNNNINSKLIFSKIYSCCYF